MSRLLAGNTPAVDLGLQLVHLTSGEDIVGKVFRDEDGYSIERPVVPQVMSNGQQMRVALMPLRPYIEQETPIYVLNQHVLFVTPINEQMQQLYVQFTSNIVIAAASEVKLS